VIVTFSAGAAVSTGVSPLTGVSTAGVFTAHAVNIMLKTMSAQTIENNFWTFIFLPPHIVRKFIELIIWIFISLLFIIYHLQQIIESFQFNDKKIILYSPPLWGLLIPEQLI
jgi:hypothetical protein